MPTPKLSVVIPAFNCATHLPRAVESALAQSFGDIEVLIVDDGSSDDTASLAERWSDVRSVRYVRRPHRGGVAIARNAGIEHARAEYLMWLDADDTLPCDSAALHVDALGSSGASWAVCDVTRRTPRGDSLWSGFLPNTGALDYCLIERFPARAIGFRRDVYDRVGQYDPDLVICEDWDLIARLLAAREPFVYVDRPAYVYHARTGSLTRHRGSDRNLRAIELIYRRHYRSRLRAAAVRRAYARYMWLLAGEYRTVGSPITDWGRVLLASIRAQPGQVVTFLRRALRRTTRHST